MAQLPVTLPTNIMTTIKCPVAVTDDVMVHLVNICADSYIIGVSWIRI